MPELPEVRVVSSQLNINVKNKIIKKVHVFVDKLIHDTTVEEFKILLKNEKVLKVENYGKFILFFLSNEKILISHLRMEGKYNFYEPSKIRQPHDHVIFEFEDRSNLHYNDTRKFGTFHIRHLNDYLISKPLNKLAKIPADTNWENLYKIFLKKKKAIKTTLLDQTIIVGLGNIYVDEVLYACKIHPETLTNQITQNQVKQILKESTRILDLSTSLGGSSINSYTSLNKQAGSFQNFLKVHTKKGQPCPECNTIISKIKVNGRGTYYCEKCQKK